MKDKYYGDRTDYIKHSLLSRLSRYGYDLAVHWNKTPNDDSNDGKKISYLSDPIKWRHFDPCIFDSIKNSIELGDRTLHNFEKSGFIKGAKFCYDIWSNDRCTRRISVEKLVSQLKKNHIIFFDPDNGLETKSISSTSKQIHKYVYYEELRIPWESGHGLIIYQHYPRINRKLYLETRFSEIFSQLPEVEGIIALSSSFAAFILIAKKSQFVGLKEYSIDFANIWSPHLSLFAMQKHHAGISKVSVGSSNSQGELVF